MKLIPISPNVLINPKDISCIEQKLVKGIEITYVWLGNRSYILEIPLNEFYKNLQIMEDNEPKQFFAG